MKSKFGLWPKFALLLLLAVATFQKFQVADRDLKQHKTDQVYIEDHQWDQVTQIPVAQTQAQHLEPDCKSEPPMMQTPVMYSQVEVQPDTIDVGGPPVDSPPDASNTGLWALIKKNWGSVVAALLGVVEVIVRLTPTEKDNSVFNFLKFILDKIIPNQRKEGGAH